MAERKEYGPSWLDAMMEMRRLRKEIPVSLVFILSETASISGIPGLIFTVRAATGETVLGACGYGRAYPNGAATMPAAIVHACIKAEREWIENQGRVTRYVMDDVIAEQASDDIPF